MVKGVLKRVLGDPQVKNLKRVTAEMDRIAKVADKYEGKSVDELRVFIDELKDQVRAETKTLEEVKHDVFAIARSMSTHVLGMTHFDVQLVGGMALHEGSVAEMRTGEGKTLVATLPVSLNALSGKGVHVVTVNDYLAQRDAGWMAELYNALGLTTAVIIADHSFIFDKEYSNDEHDDVRLKHLRACSRQDAYNADITYGTNNEFGFDYLRDNMVREAAEQRQRPLNFAIVDEVDSILIDEARTPLIISAPSSSSGSSYSTFATIAKQLKEDHYEKDEKRKSSVLTDEGVEKVQKLLGIDNMYGPENVRSVYHMDQALRAQTLFKRDKDYVVNEEGEVIIVDEFTGRLMQGRRYNEGLHQAIEAKEGVEVLQESMTLATISFQNYFRLYDKLAGMTGTAETESEEFFEIYKLDVVVIPTNQEVKRTDRPDRIYKSEAGKFAALVNEVKNFQEDGQPVLVGTASVEKNELLSRMFAKAGIKHEVLNAKAHEREAGIVSNAGQLGAVTIATNIAGRGTDIVLAEGVKEKGGLVVLGSERHEARRIDNQLRGRCGRQGDPGLTQFYVSAQDELMRVFGGDRVSSLMDKLGVDEETPIENRAVSKALENAQKKVESYNYDARKNVVKYDDVMNRQRRSVYGMRQDVLTQDDISDQIQDMLKQEAAFFAPKENEKTTDLAKEVDATFPFDDETVEELADTEYEMFAVMLEEKVLELYQSREKQFGEDTMRKIEREIQLQVLDNLWMQHLENMQHLREGITWRSIGQRDPLVEYRREGQDMFKLLQTDIRSETIRTLFRAQPVIHDHGDHQHEVIETELTKAAQTAEAIQAKVEKKRTKVEARASVKEDKQRAKASSVAIEVDSRELNKKKREAAKKKKAKRKKGRR